jgi:hypothetical protein
VQNLQSEIKKKKEKKLIFISSIYFLGKRIGHIERVQLRKGGINHFLPKFVYNFFQI